MVSVVVAVYNAENYLDKCIESICNQSYQELEIVLVNDGSKDKSGEICDKWAQRDKRIKVLHKENTGVSDTRNQGIAMATGEYVAFVDADDYLDQEHILHLVEQEKRGILPITGYYIEIETPERKLQTPRVLSSAPVEYLSEERLLDLYRTGLLTTIWNKLYVTDLIKKDNISFDPNISLGEDVMFNLEYIRKTKVTFAVINTPSYHYMRRGTESLDHKYVPDFYEHQVRIFETLIADAKRAGATQQEIMKLQGYYFNALVVALDNMHCNQNKIGKKKASALKKDLCKRKEFAECVKEMQGIMCFIYRIRLWGIRCGLHRFDYGLRGIVKKVMGLE